MSLGHGGRVWSNPSEGPGEPAKMKCLGLVRAVSGLFAVLVSCIAATTGTCQSTVPDPQSLIAEWQGSWVSPSDLQANGQYYLTITKIEGDTVHALFEIFGRGAFKGERVGTLAGNTLTFETKFNRAVFTIDGDRMRGAVRSLTTGQAVQDISLWKKK